VSQGERGAHEPDLFPAGGLSVSACRVGEQAPEVLICIDGHYKTVAPEAALEFAMRIKLSAREAQALGHTRGQRHP